MYLDTRKSGQFQKGEGAYSDFGSCTLLIKGHMVLFGGNKETHQISVVYPWGMKRIQSLQFPFIEGQCAYFDQTVYLCFDSEDQKLCRKR